MCGLAGLFHVFCRMRLDGLDIDFIKLVHEKFPVLRVHDSLDRSTENLNVIFLKYVIFIQFHTAVQCRLTAEREQDSLRTLLGNDFFHKERRHRKEVDLVCDSFRCLDRGNVRVDQDGLNAFFAQSLERL